MQRSSTHTFTLQQWLNYQQSLHQQVIELGLDRVREVARSMSLHPTCPIITVAGTNGKGSTCAFLNSILSVAGYKTGIYTSPHLVRYNERIAINDRLVSDEELCQQFQKIEEARQEVSLTPFEFGVLAAVSLFIEQQVDVMILEVGLGGRLDAVNIFDPTVSIVTSIGIDHIEYLGDNREDIGREKAGIFRPQTPAICADPDPPQSIINYAKQINAPLKLWGKDFSLTNAGESLVFVGCDRCIDSLPYPALKGGFQLHNAAAAICALLSLSDRIHITTQHIEYGLKNVFIAGRYQQLTHHCTIILDVAHNPHGAQQLKKNLIEQPCYGRTKLVFGMLRDKDIRGVVEQLHPVTDEWHVAPVPDLRGANASELAHFIEQVGGKVKTHDSFQEAMTDALNTSEALDRIVVTGSFVTVGLVTDYLVNLG
ncbi:bifunctional tetrahydrofolate synthase/dihydrofolate synthase [Ferrovum sp. PN-J185]|uniref:bifunctional tetrahydrofolate synthase/dihydrofolate synthase n=1 Tax=Ferrovum sp. PN-J185 TaxID=1356306 RepID=UPI0007931383|nr:bifunctional tetrahydrofolate synthase/dihydrofolate synthase [Ferrovum sp. PN-J185]KXW56410.1 bifunctional protein FolC [Ferrovum sp. PN-J185]MCC6069133.1 bifunctional tetrahydrofolate synthase/dihydrofolate synthase [Ferrovum sp. PN-J185]MDE1890886.1 bifunctional tetrahydrofolate synthase/dihydrofolate synthase [Betaproteobacteria bacterium]MDE2055802.1 bifunctional tetrahydrofolate synthase/dihydrofolate synthase [Betaproteobacteria bacterium]